MNKHSENWQAEYSKVKQANSLDDTIKAQIKQRAVINELNQQPKEIKIGQWWALACALLVVVVSINMIGIYQAPQPNIPITSVEPKEPSNGIIVDIIEPNLATQLAAEIILDKQQFSELQRNLRHQLALAEQNYQHASAEQGYYIQLAKLQRNQRGIELSLCAKPAHPIFAGESSVFQNFDISTFEGTNVVELVLNSRGQIIAIKTNHQASC